jgi:hypothetical protein
VACCMLHVASLPSRSKPFKVGQHFNRFSTLGGYLHSVSVNRHRAGFIPELDF